MKSYMEGGWVVTTPMYVGASDDMAKATTCSHEWIETVPERLGERPAMDKCKHCVAVRARYSPDASEVHDVKNVRA